MKKLLLLCTAVASTILTVNANNPDIVNIQGAEHQLNKLIERQIGPGCVYYRYRIQSFPLNINLVVVDSHNPNIQIETNVPNDRSAGTELLVDAAKRHDAPNHHAITAQNGNFWIVSTQPMWDAYNASTHGVNMRNGMLAIDAKSYPNWWWWRDRNTEVAGIVGTTDKNELFIDVCTTSQTFSSEKTGRHEFASCNKGFRPGEASIYTPWYEPTRQFLPLANKDNQDDFTIDESAECTEVMLNMTDGGEWTGGRDMQFVVKEVRQSNGRGTLGEYDLAIVARNADINLRDLVPGDIVTLNYSWAFDRNGQIVIPEITQAIAGNMMVMKDGQITEQNAWDSYDTMVYSRSAYGTDKENRYLYMVTIDKSNDSTFGGSNGCTTADMCDILRHLGCWNLINVDAGGSAELMVDGRIINTTTEGTPRAVGNGWMVFDVSDDTDREVASIAFYDLNINVPQLSVSTPRIVAYNKFGSIIDQNYTGHELSTDSELGTAYGNVFKAGDCNGAVELTATAPNGYIVKHTINIVEAKPYLPLSTIILDSDHSYVLEVKSVSNGVVYDISPSNATWSIDDSTVADIDDQCVIYAKKNGTAKLTGKLSTMEQTVDVRVENVDADDMPLLDESWTGWTVKGNTGLKIGTLGSNGLIPYTYGSPRNSATITMTRNIELIGYPTAFALDFKSSLPVSSVDVRLRPVTADPKTPALKISVEDGYTAEENHSAVIQIKDICDPDDVTAHPLVLTDIRFNIPAKNDFKGEQTLTINNIRALYGNQGGIDIINPDKISTINVEPNPVAAGQTIVINSDALKSATLYNAAGIAVARLTKGSNTMSVPSTPGIYLLSAFTEDGSPASARVIVK